MSIRRMKRRMGRRRRRRRRRRRMRSKRRKSRRREEDLKVAERRPVAFDFGGKIIRSN